ncbi:hypothetical protein [Azospirillum thermophilum]|uniref:hypothetical protein n=1 Tax=Azospirillum thermophilum TaxID=2202148 RepID=UPI001FE5DA43|nr:hypothetical protein [Azospirillum thermophilum]
MSAAAPAGRPAAVAGARSPAPLPALPRAWVVFRGDSPLWWLRLLRPGFRHCLALLNDGRHWIVVDPLSPYTEVAVPPLPPGYDLPGWYRGLGLTVVAAPVARPPARPAPWAPFTCVEAVKRVLGCRPPSCSPPGSSSAG